jgi:hypothetical protein
MLLELKEKLGSLITALDVIYVIEGVKPVSRLMVSEKDEGFFSFLKKNGLFYRLSDFKIIKHIDKTRNFSDMGLRVDKDDKRKGELFIYISKDRNLALAAKDAEALDKDDELGRLLGYPECCCRFFEKNKEKAQLGTNDYLPFTFKQSKGIEFPWQTNYCLRVFDIALISHFPCSFHCPESRSIAETNLGIIRKYNLDVEDYFKFALKSGVIYSEGVGVYSMKKNKGNAGHFEYSPDKIIASMKNDFYNILKRRNRIRALDKNNFFIGEVNIEDDQTFFGLFS